MSRRILLFFIILMTTSWIQVQAQERSKVMFYRVREFLTSREYKITINQQWSAHLGPRDFFQIELPPGKLEIEAGGYPAQKKHLSLSLQPGQTLYLRGVEEIDFLEQYLLMSVVPPEEAIREMKAIKRMREVKVVKK